MATTAGSPIEVRKCRQVMVLSRVVRSVDHRYSPKTGALDSTACSTEGNAMVMMTAASHQFVDQKLVETAAGIEKAQRAAAEKKGYVNFAKAVHVIYECRTEIDQETENDAVIGHLKTAAVALAAFNAGDAAASVQTAMRAIKDIVDKLPD
jgi:hypothetical protein